MAVVVAELPTIDSAIGFDENDVVSSDDSFAKRFQVQDPDDCLFADFTGFTPEFDLLDSAGAIVITGAVTPSPGDASGTFLATLTDVQTGANIGEFAYRLRIDNGGGTVKTLFCGAFKITQCKAAA